MPAFVALEVAAQAAAVQRALEADAHGEPRSGTLVAIRDAVFHTDALPVETPLVATARRIARAGPLAVHEVSIAGPDGRTCLRAILSTHAAEAALDPPP